MAVVIKNLPEFFNSLDKLKKDAAEYFDGLMNRGAEYGVTIAKQLAPKDDGKLRQNIAVFKNEEVKFTYGIGVNTSVVPYAAYHEFGTGSEVDIPEGYEKTAEFFIGEGKREVNIPPTPYLYPSLLEARVYILRRLVEEIEAGKIFKK